MKENCDKIVGKESAFDNSGKAFSLIGDIKTSNSVLSCDFDWVLLGIGYLSTS